MNFAQFRKTLYEHEYFCSDWIYRYIPDFDKRRLYEWTQRWLLLPLKKGWYLFADIQRDQQLIYHLASVLYRPSYISLLTALSYYGLIPETVVTIQSISTKKTSSYHLEWAHRDYRSCKTVMFGWYDIVTSQHGPLLIATPEKAIVDLFYYYPQYRTLEDIKSLRINHYIRDELDANDDKMRDFALATWSQVTRKAVEIFIQYIHSQW